MNVFTAEQMRAFDRAATEEYGIPSIVLMENAALRVVEFLEAKFAPLSEKRVVVLCGKGNNGGDGLTIARHLLGRVADLRVQLFASIEELKGDADINAHAFEKCWTGHLPPGFCGFSQWDAKLDKGGDNALNSSEMQGAFEEIAQADLVLDAILGTGFSGEVRDARTQAALTILGTTVDNPRITRIAIDLPSGVNSDTGESAPQTVPVHYTVTFAGPKRGGLTRDGLKRAGETWIGDIGTSPATMLDSKTGLHARTGVECLNRAWAHRNKPHRPMDAHKGDAGRVLICGGSIGLSGAPAIATRAALRIGAGLCTAALSEPVLQTLSANESEPTGHALPADKMGRLKAEAADEIAKLWETMNAVAVGPGLSREKGPLEFTRRVVRECPQPLILDADALYALPDIADAVKARKAPTVLTPHPGEMGELMGLKTPEVQDDRFGIVAKCAKKYNAITVLKGARTLVAHPDGRIWVNLTGNAGMATGGSGDALTGTIAGLLAQTKDALTATLLGVYVHGLAGDLAYQTLGNGLIAGDIVERLPAALLELDKPGTPPINARLRKLE